ncbi:hypothetical protein TSUD_259740 [Trifolium subterraneum]|uniref:F-box domain-containing protein n=1 Tax=Trifolium subterraneum TaxID=3900 RepID=A0A2Z6MPR1_TRISU|nr:hypothetical protein TSUD_259740 [Trifolium subterraneum]
MEEEAMLRPHNSAASEAILPNEVMLEIVSWLPVKHVMQLRCINKFFKTIIFDPCFVQMHLNKSAENSQIAFMCYENHHSFLGTLSVHRLLQNQLTTFHQSDPYFLLYDVSRLRRRVIGSCNGLLLVGMLYGRLSIWNPAMRTKSENLTILPNSTPDLDECCKFCFGYDNSTRTYKVVVFYYVEVKRGYPKSVVKVLSLGDNSWRDIQCFPVLPLQWSYLYNNNGVHLNGTINWLAFRDYNSSVTVADQYSSVTVDQCVILSLDLSTETYTQLLLPPSFDKVHKCHRPKISVLMDYIIPCIAREIQKGAAAMEGAAEA